MTVVKAQLVLPNNEVLYESRQLDLLPGDSVSITMEPDKAPKTCGAVNPRLPSPCHLGAGHRGAHSSTIPTAFAWANEDEIWPYDPDTGALLSSLLRGRQDYT